MSPVDRRSRHRRWDDYPPGLAPFLLGTAYGVSMGILMAVVLYWWILR